MLRYWIAFAVTASFALPVFAAEIDCAKNGQEVLAIEKIMSDAQLKSDTKTVEKFLVPEYTFTIPNGKVITQAKLLEDMKASWKPLFIEHSEQTIQCNGPVITLRGKGLYRWQGKEGIEFAREQYTSTYVKIEGSWKKVSSHASCLEGRCS